MRSAWIEMTVGMVFDMLAESRSMRSAWIEIGKQQRQHPRNPSRSMRSAWIEIPAALIGAKGGMVALHAERVD